MYTFIQNKTIPYYKYITRAHNIIFNTMTNLTAERRCSMKPLIVLCFHRNCTTQHILSSLNISYCRESVNIVVCGGNNISMSNCKWMSYRNRLEFSEVCIPCVCLVSMHIQISNFILSKATNPRNYTWLQFVSNTGRSLQVDIFWYILLTKINK